MKQAPASLAIALAFCSKTVFLLAYITWHKENICRFESERIESIFGHKANVGAIIHLCNVI